MRVSKRRRPRIATIGLAIIMVTASVALISGAPVASADTTSLTGDENTHVVTGWWTYSGLTGAEVNAKLSLNNARLTDVEIYDSTPKFTVTMVKNTGSYAATGGWWWYYGYSAASISVLLSNNGARLIDIQPYKVGSVTKYAFIMVKNSGSAARAWWWYTNATWSYVQAKLTANNARLVDIETYTEGTTKRYAVVMVRNTGADAKAWQVWLNMTTAGVTQKANAFGGRIVDMQRQADGTYNIILVKQTGGDNIYYRYYWKIGTISRAAQIATLYDTRLMDLNTYISSGTRYYDAIMIDNASSEDRRINNIMAPKFTSSSGSPFAQFGWYLKRVGGGTITASGESLQYEPASAIKVLHNLRAMKDIQSGAKTTSSSGFYYNYPNSPNFPNTKDSCPVDGDEINANKVNASWNFLHDNMMSISDNRATRYFALFYGLPGLQSLANSVGMTKTTIGQARIGCGKTGGSNYTTLKDLGLLYESVENGTQLNDTNSARTEFYQPMNSGVGSGVQSVVGQEAVKLGKSQSVINSFISNMANKVKGGSYNIGCGVVQAGCTGAYYYYRDFAGRIRIPFKSGGSLAPVTYVWGRYVDSLKITNGGSTTTFDNIQTAIDGEILRATINAALKTW